MASTNNPRQPIAVGSNEGIEAQNEAHFRREDTTRKSLQPDQQHGIEPFPSIDTNLSPIVRQPRNDLLSPADILEPQRTFSNSEEDPSLDPKYHLDDKYRDIWEDSMEEMGSTGTPHKKTAVLMVSWCEELDELGTGLEVKELAETFRSRFHYDVVEVELTAEQLPMKQLAFFLTKFINDFDNESTLLIVYYAGHGVAPQPGELYFASNMSKKANKQLSDKNSVPWHKAEAFLQIASGDILLIFDCCYAGNLDPHLAGRGYWATRCFELLAACKHDERTHPPGPKSFTKALIWALGSLLDEKEKFSTRELLTQISRAKGFPEHQSVRIIDRGGPCNYQLVLAAVPVRSNDPKLEAVSPRPLISRPKKFIDLRFWYTEFPAEDEVRELSTRLKQIIRNEHIMAERIGWLRLGDMDNQVNNIVKKWRWLGRRRSMSTLPPLMIPPLPISSHLQPSYTPPPSQSGNSSVSDAQIESSDPFSIFIKVPESTPSTRRQDGEALPENNETNTVECAEVRGWPLVPSSGLDRRSKNLPVAIRSGIIAHDPATVLVIASISVLTSFGLYKYFFNKY